ncbi:MAG TPA: UDP-N-acetylmuramate--L-alanine ligase [Burkholderiales bacterium]|nr:UDP-N-acetylmuramate--L-alanine ligase [Burkholderiales bacterium]
MKHKVKQLHFVGIGGSGMSGIAEVLLNLGYVITGSDVAENAATRRLSALGVAIFREHAAENVGRADAVVVSTAVSADNPEVIAARERSIPVVPRAIMLAELMRLRQGIAIAGAHGKTTTTSLIASILAQAGMDPTFVIGGRLEAAGANSRLGKGEFIVVEADESDASFLYLMPILAVVTNIDADHMETYGHDFGRLKQAFVDFLEHIPFYGRAVLCVDDPNVQAIMPQLTKPVTTYGLSPSADIRAVDVRHDNGRMHFGVVNGGGKRVMDVALNLPGNHNVLNALAAIAISLELNIAQASIAQALTDFAGVGRRFERYGEISLPTGGAFTLVDDYGHHPAEMAATIAAARAAFPGRRLLLAFQPHRYTRTRDLFEDFVAVLSSVDALILTDVYAAGEAPIVAADGRALARALRVGGRIEPIFAAAVEDVPPAIRDNVRADDVVLTMGAGSVGSIAAELAGGFRVR